MKVVIIGLDALELSFVEKFDLKHLKQKEYGKVMIPKKCFHRTPSYLYSPNYLSIILQVVFPPYSTEKIREPYTPQVWYSFLTGRLPTDLCARALNKEVINALRRFSIKTGTHEFKGKYRVLKYFTRAKILRYHQKEDFKTPTIFDLAKQGTDINAPIYSRGWTLKLGAKPSDFNRFGDFIDCTLKRELEDFTALRAKIFSILKRKHWDLLFAYTKLLDVYGHLAFSRLATLYEAYAVVNDFVKKIGEMLNDTFILVISDHGIKRLDKTAFGKHSDYAFYSVNHHLNLNNPKITDFYQVVKRILYLSEGQSF